MLLEINMIEIMALIFVSHLCNTLQHSSDPSLLKYLPCVQSRWLKTEEMQSLSLKCVLFLSRTVQQHRTEEWEAGAAETGAGVWVAQRAPRRDRHVPKRFSFWLKARFLFPYA